jgi:ankyrin repeat protein
VEALLGAGASIDARNGVGETALLVAARAGNNEVVRLFLERHADVNAADNRQHTALYYAGERGSTEIIEMLLTAGAEE